MDVDAPRDTVFCTFCEREIPTSRWACSQMDDAARRNEFVDTDDAICKDELARHGYANGPHLTEGTK